MNRHPSRPPAPSLLRLDIAAPFALVALIWGSTWWVITTQLADIPSAWSITYRFLLAAPAMALLALMTGKSLTIGAKAHRLALLIGLTQFCGNYMFVYEAERHLTSGIVALLMGLLLVPNVVLGWLLLGERISARFVGGSALAIAGIALLLANEARAAPVSGNVWLGVLLATGGLLAAAVANVVQANDTGRAVPMASLLAWSMAYGTLIDGALAWALFGPPVLPRDGAYWAGAAYLAFAGSVVTFPLYFKLVRDLGAGKAAYNGVVTAGAGDAAVHLARRLQLDAARRGGIAAGFGRTVTGSIGPQIARAALRDRSGIGGTSPARASPCHSPPAGSRHRRRGPWGRGSPAPVFARAAVPFRASGRPPRSLRSGGKADRRRGYRHQRGH